jgi:probable rRNA maturation factor
MTLLNRRVFGRGRPTDVIALAFRRPGPGAPVIGDIYVAPDVVKRNAGAAGIAAREEFARVVVHGALHALGMMHPDGEGRERSALWRRQERILAAARRDGLW